MLGCVYQAASERADTMTTASHAPSPTPQRDPGLPEGTETYAVDYLYDGQRYTTRVIVGPRLSNQPTAFEDIRRIISVRLTGSNRPADVAAITVESLILLAY